jgi:SNF2 family DNA or RNA helicase
MAVLHGSWLLDLPVRLSSDQISQNQREIAAQSGCFLIWGETWRRVEPTLPSIELQPHPFALRAAELTALLRSLQQTQQINWTVAAVPLVLTAELEHSCSPQTSSPQTSRQNRGSAQTLAAAIPATAIHSERWRSIAFSLPTHRLHHPDGVSLLPQHSAASLEDPVNLLSTELQPWLIEGICLQPLEAIQLLNSLPLSSVGAAESFLGADLRYWSHIARWTLDLLARSKFLPRLDLLNQVESPEGQPEGQAIAVAHWQALLDSAIDQSRLEHFAKQMPLACRTYQSAVGVPSTELTFHQPQTLLFSFLHQVIGAQVRAIATPTALPTVKFPKDLPLREWLQGLGSAATVMAESSELERLGSMLATWVAPLQFTQQLASFRTCFYLQPPAENRQDWTLEYFLQASNDPEFLVSARTIWNNPVDRLSYLGRAIEHPQETLLAGLGLASRLYPVLEPSLQVQQPQASQLNPLQVYEFIKNTAWRLQDSGFGVVLPPGLSNQQGWASRLGLSVRAEAPLGKKQRLGLQSLLNFKWELTIGGQRLSKAEFDRLVALNMPLVEINGEWVELRPQDVRAAQAFFTSRKDMMALSLEDALRMSTGDTQMIEKLPVVSFESSGVLQELINTLTKGNESVESIPIPQSFCGELRPYQVKGVSWLAFLERWGLGACLADDMGLGKTIQLIALLLHLQEQNALDQPVLLVCPTSVLGNWEREVKRFGSSLKTVVHHGDKRSQGKNFAKAVKDCNLVVTSYALTYRDVKELQSVSWQGVVLDEAQNIKNSESKQSQAVRQLETRFRIALTGTPVENRLSELWSILDFLNPGYLGPRNFFQRRFAIPIERYGDTASLQTLRSLVQPFILRRLKTDRTIIQDLPDKQEMTVFCGLSAEQAALYQQAVDQSLLDIESAEGIQRHGMILALLVKLKQICNHPELLKEQNKPSDSTFLSRSGKLQRLEEMLEELLLEGDRTLVFTQFAEWGKHLKIYLEQQFNQEVMFLYGGSSKKQREEMVDRFQNDPQGPRIFILSLKAGGVGLNLTRANHVFHFDRWWNPAVENQATDRVFRIGQTRNVQVHKFVCTGTLEERIHELIESKKALSEQIVGTGENWLTDLDTNQLRNLLLLDRTTVIDD